MIDMISLTAMIERASGRAILLVIFLGIIAPMFWGFKAFAGATYNAARLNPVTVTASRLEPDFNRYSRVVNVLRGEDLRRLPVQTLQQALNYIPGLDVKSRNPYGVQGDVSIRGSTFSQVLILVDGVRVNDPQTGHHNLNVGVPPEQIERIEVLQGPGASIYGADAVGGVINIITRKPEKNNVSLQGARGENNTWSGASSLSLVKNDIFLGGTVSQDSSSGFRRDTDYRVYTAGGKAGWRGEKSGITLSYSYLDKEFGAYDFYTPGLHYPSREWNRSQLLTARGTFRAGAWEVIPRGYYRHHFDEFRLDRDRPEYYKNKSKTDLFGGSISARGFVDGVGSLSLGIEVQEDRIDSTGLGDHNRNWISGFGEWGIEKNDRFSLDAGFRVDGYSDYGCEISPAVSISFRPLNSLNLRASAGRSFRVPSYTELYYSSPTNKGNPDLDPEQAWSVEGGLDWKIYGSLALHFTSFYRKESDIIDWVKYPGNSFWQVVNSGDVETFGLEAGFELSRLKWLTLTGNYDYLNKSIDRNKDYESKYVLNYPRHQFKLLAISLLPWNSSASLSITYQDRVDLGNSVVLDGRLSKKFGNVEIFTNCTNLTDESYQEIPGIDQPGRRVELGIRIVQDF